MASPEKSFDTTKKENIFEQSIESKSVENTELFETELAEEFTRQSKEKEGISTEIDAVLEQVDTLDDDINPEEIAENNGIISQLAEKIKKSKLLKAAVFGASLLLPAEAHAGTIGNNDYVDSKMTVIEENSGTGNFREAQLTKSLEGVTYIDKVSQQSIEIQNPHTIKVSSSDFNQTVRPQLRRIKPLRSIGLQKGQLSTYGHNAIQNQNIRIHPNARIGNYNVAPGGKLTIGPNVETGSISVGSGSEVNIGGVSIE